MLGGGGRVWKARFGFSGQPLREFLSMPEVGGVSLPLVPPCRGDLSGAVYGACS